ncbi:nuclear transport factor 2 family protein [Marinactinospora rubrisoli]|uniref:Nuclear transport factor 2 family protein n=1 Tax=Marinactinospora rubrisoli TaxID=2715399 RepID=A0ABW2KN67_9ACTN
MVSSSRVDVVEGFGSAELFAQVQMFYARQMRLLDEGRVEEWAATFTEEGVFAADARPEPARGRAVIAAAAGAAWERLVASGVRHRHWLGMVEVGAESGGRVRSRCYALVLAVPRGGPVSVQVSTVCEDVLVRGGGGGWLVEERSVRRDDLGEVGAG